jgi:uncharacterized protein DUF1566
VPDRSMFKRCLLLGLEGDADLTRDGYVTGTELGLYLSDKVIQSTRRAQHPQYGKIRTPELARGDFVFRLGSSVAVKGPVTSKTVILPKESKTSLDDILKAEEAEHQAKEKWRGWQKDRETEYRKIKKIDESNNLTSQQKTVAWQRFLVAVSQDNPHSRQDDEMRTYSRSRLNHWQKVKPSATKPNIPASSIDYDPKHLGIDDGAFIAYANGVVYDKITGLEWYAGPDKDTNWHEAKRWVESLNIAGGGWRMPTVAELRTLYILKPLTKRNIKEPFVTPFLSKTSGIDVWASKTEGSKLAYCMGFGSLYFRMGSYHNRSSSKKYRGFAVRSLR